MRNNLFALIIYCNLSFIFFLTLENIPRVWFQFQGEINLDIFKVDFYLFICFCSNKKR